MADYPGRGRNAEEHIGVIASTSALAAASSTKWGTPNQFLMALVTLSSYHTQRSAPRRVNVPFAGSIFRPVTWAALQVHNHSRPRSSAHVPYVYHLCTPPSPDTGNHWEAYSHSTTHKDPGAPSCCHPIP